MDHKKLKFVNVFLVLGVMFFIAVGVVSFVRPEYLRNYVFSLLTLFQIVLGTVIITSSILATRYASHLFIGLMLFAYGLMTFLIAYVLPFTIYNCWPVYGILGSICLMISGYFRYRKMRVVYVFPSIAVFVFSIWYALFSFKIVKLPFSKVVIISTPFLLVAVALFLILYFFAQQKYSRLIIKEDEFEESDF